MGERNGRSEAAERSRRRKINGIEKAKICYMRMPCLHSESSMCPVALHQEDSTTARLKSTRFNQNRHLSRSIQLLYREKKKNKKRRGTAEGGAGAKQKPKGISASHVTLNGKNQNCVLVRRECAHKQKQVATSSYNGAAVLRH